MYKPVIGLEIHAELNTKTKMFCDSLNDSDEKHPNINVCPICMGHPGCLPVINEDAVKKVIMAGLALNCKIAEDTFFERKNYFYPDLPKGYQISQYQKPLCENGYLDIDDPSTGSGSKRIRITRIHLEEDAGRLYHLPGKDYSLVDFNRAGVPLMELVTEPDLESGQEVRKFSEELRLIWKYLGVSDADMEKGQLRIEVNISLRPEFPISNFQFPNKEQKLGTKVEIKNLNSIKFAADVVDYEIKRQTELLEKREKVVQETRGWDENKKSTFSQRSKEEAHDYRYFPEPDLPPILIADGRASPALSEQGGPPTTGIFIDEIKAQLPELPQQRRERFAKQYALPERDIELFTTDKPLGDYFEHVASEVLAFDKWGHYKTITKEDQERLLKLVANYTITELKRMADEIGADPNDTKITPEHLAGLVFDIHTGKVSSSGAQIVMKDMFKTGRISAEVIEKENLAQLSDVSELEMAVDKVVANNGQAAEDYKKGKEASLKFLIGMVMRESKGKANPQMVEEILKNKLK